MHNEMTDGNVCTGEGTTTSCNQHESDTRIFLHIVHSLICGTSTVPVKTSDYDVILIPIRHLPRFETIRPE